MPSASSKKIIRAKKPLRSKKIKQTASFSLEKFSSKLAKVNYLPILMVLLLIASYLLGMLTTKVQYLESKQTLQVQQTANPSQGGQQAPAITNDTIKGWGKEIGLDMNKFTSCFDNKKYQNLIDKDNKDGQTAGVSGTPTFFINGKSLVGAQPYTEFQKALDAELGQASINPFKYLVGLFKQSAYAQENTTPTQPIIINVTNGHLSPLGNINAKITIVEFSDFQCPFCRRFYSETFAQLKKDYLDTGKAVLYYRQFPLTDIHPNATPFANASECANEQGKFWEMHDKIFSSQGNS